MAFFLSEQVNQQFIKQFLFSLSTIYDTLSMSNLFPQTAVLKMTNTLTILQTYDCLNYKHILFVLRSFQKGIALTHVKEGRDDDLYFYGLLGVRTQVSLHHLSVFTPCLHSQNWIEIAIYSVTQICSKCCITGSYIIISSTNGWGDVIYNSEAKYWKMCLCRFTKPQRIQIT